MAVVVADRRARDAHLVAVRADDHAHQVGEITAGAAPFLEHVDAALGRDQRRVHVVDRRVRAALEGPVQCRDGEQPSVVTRQATVVGERQPIRPPAGELERQAPELRGQRHERAQRLHVLGADRRNVDRVRDERALERGSHLLGDDHAGPVLCLLGGGGKVRGDDDVVELEQWALVRFRGENVKRGSGHLAGAQCLEQRPLVDQLAARGVDHTDAVPHLGECLLADGATGLVRQRQVEGQEVGRAVDVLGRLDPLGPELAKALLRNERVVGDDAESEPERPPRHLLPDPAETEHAERLALELDPAVAPALPASLLQRRVRLRNVARKRDQQADRVLGRGDDGRLRRVRDDDSAACGRLDVDVVDPHPSSADHLQAVCAADDLGGQLRRRPDHDRVVGADLLCEIAVEPDVDLEPLAQELHSRLGDRLGDQNTLHTRACSSYASSALVTATPRSISAPRSASTNSTAASAVVMSKTSK